MPNEMPGAGGQFIQTNMGTPTVGLNQAANWGGSSMQPHTVVPLLPGQVFGTRGTGKTSLAADPRFGGGYLLSGTQGTIDLLVTMGATGAARTICYLTDDLVTPTRYIAVKMDNANKPFAKITNNLGSVIGVMTPATAVGAGLTASIRLAWNSLGAVDVLSGRHASFRLNREIAAGSTWTTDPTADWASFQPHYLVCGGLLFGDSDFNGSILSVQLSNVVTP